MASRFQIMIRELWKIEQSKQHPRKQDEIAKMLGITDRTFRNWLDREPKRPYLPDDVELSQISKVFHVSKIELQKALEGRKHDFNIPPEEEKVTLSLASKEHLLDAMTELALIYENLATNREYKQDTAVKMKYYQRDSGTGEITKVIEETKLGKFLKDGLSDFLKLCSVKLTGNTDPLASFNDDELNYLSKYDQDEATKLLASRIKTMRGKKITKTEFRYAYEMWGELLHIKTGVDFNKYETYIYIMPSENNFNALLDKIKSVSSVEYEHQKWITDNIYNDFKTQLKNSNASEEELTAIDKAYLDEIDDLSVKYKSK